MIFAGSNYSYYFIWYKGVHTKIKGKFVFKVLKIYVKNVRIKDRR